MPKGAHQKCGNCFFVHTSEAADARYVPVVQFNWELAATRTVMLYDNCLYPGVGNTSPPGKHLSMGQRMALYDGSSSSSQTNPKMYGCRLYYKSMGCDWSSTSSFKICNMGGNMKWLNRISYQGIDPKVPLTPGFTVRLVTKGYTISDLLLGGSSISQVRLSRSQVAPPSPRLDGVILYTPRANHFL